QNARVMERFCTRALVIGDGQVILDGTVEEALNPVGRGQVKEDEDDAAEDAVDLLDSSAERDEWRAD
ncbi:MAG: hypothetical protein WAO50_00045, partial [Candidatus Nanopelagicales bacterium]